MLETELILSRNDKRNEDEEIRIKNKDEGERAAKVCNAHPLHPHRVLV